MNTTLETLDYTRKPPENWAGLVADVEDCLGDTPHPDEQWQRDAVELLWDEGQELDAESFEAARVFAIGRIGMEFMRYAMPQKQAFIGICVENVANTISEYASATGETPDSLVLGDLVTKSFIAGWPSDTPTDEGIPRATRLIANTFSVVRPDSEGHIPRETIPYILSEVPGREAAKASVFGGALFMLQLTLAKYHEARTGERPSLDTPISDIATAATIKELDFYYASCQATKMHIGNLNMDDMWKRTRLFDNQLVLATDVPKQRTASTTNQQVIRNKTIGCPGMNIAGAIAFVCETSKTLVNATQAALIAESTQAV